MSEQKLIYFYKIQSSKTDNIFIGSTSGILDKCLKRHREIKKLKICSSYEIIELGCRIKVISIIMCNKQERYDMENKLIKDYCNFTVNNKACEFNSDDEPEKMECQNLKNYKMGILKNVCTSSGKCILREIRHLND